MSWVRSLNMDNICFLFDSFAFHYHRGIAFLSEQDFLATRNNLIYATEILLKIAKDSNGAVKARRLMKVKEIYSLVDGLSLNRARCSNTS